MSAGCSSGAGVAEPAPLAEGAPPPEVHRGELVVSRRAVERISVMAAGEVDGVLDGAAGPAHRSLHGVRSVGIAPSAKAKVAGTRARVAVEISVAWPTPLAPVCLQVRDRVSEQVRELAGLHVDGVDVTVLPVLGDELPESERLL